MKLYLAILTLLLSSAIHGQADLIIEWQTSWVDDTSGTHATCVEQTLDGGYIAIGYRIAPDTTHLWVAKLDGDGSYQWLKQFPGSVGNKIILTSDGGYAIIGHTGLGPNYGLSDVLILKLTSNGTTVWQRHYGGSHMDYGFDIAERSDGGFVVAASTRSNDFEVTGYHGDSFYFDGWVFGVDPEGDLEWERACGGSLQDAFRSIYLHTDGSVFVAGLSRSIDGDVTGGHGQEDVWLVKLDPYGNFEWQHCYGGTLGEEAFSMEATLDDNLILAGRAESSDGDVSAPNLGLWDIWAIKVSMSGDLIWERSYGNSTGNVANDIMADADGSFTMAGLNGTSGTANWWILHISETGDLIWDHDLGTSTGVDEAYSICASPDNKYVICGRWSDDNSLHHSIVKLNQDFNVVTGKVFFDLAGDNQFNGEDMGIPNKLVQEASSGRFTFTQPAGNYSLTLYEADIFNCSVVPIEPLSATPAFHEVYFTGLQETIPNKDFALYTNDTYFDLRVTLTGSGIFRPDSYVKYYVTYTNFSPSPISPTIFLLTDPVMTLLGTTLEPTSINGDSLTWALPLIPAYQSGVIILDFQISQTVAAGEFCHTQVNITPVDGDLELTNNHDEHYAMLVASFDPNDITVNKNVLGIDEVSSGAWLDYTIRFQNTGTDTAFVVKIANPIPLNADFNSFEFVDSSHPTTLSYNNEQRLLWFTFNDIQLPDSNVNEPDSHGFLRYRIRPLTSLEVGDVIENDASIFFDFNPPVHTNSALTQIVEPTAVAEIPADNKVFIYPNPAASFIALIFPSNFHEVEVTLFDQSGKLTKRFSLPSTLAGPLQLSIDDVPAGVYYLSTKSKEGMSVNKVVKL